MHYKKFLITTLLLFTDLSVFGNVSDLGNSPNPYRVTSTASGAEGAFQLNSIQALV